MQPPTDPVQTPTAEARAMAQSLLQARHAALAYIDPQTGGPAISRIAFGRATGGFVTLISALSAHHAGLRANGACAVMLGEPGAKGDPLTHPRLMVQAQAAFVAQGSADHAGLRESWLRHQPKATLYVDFADFTFVHLTPVSALLNGGFGKAFRFAPADLAP